MEVFEVSPRGYCYGVADAIALARKTAAQKDIPRPIYLLGELVHNENITNALLEIGIQTLSGANRLELLEHIEYGTVIFTAHGVAPRVVERAKEKGLHCVDATCPDVALTHTLLETEIQNGYDIIYIGKKGHPEPEGAVGINQAHIHLVETKEDVDQLSLSTSKIRITNQTTMSLWDVVKLSHYIQEKFPESVFMKEICNATTVRQEAVAQLPKTVELCIVVGDPNSNNTNKLAEVAKQKAGVPSLRIGRIDELDCTKLKGISVVAVTSGASTPTAITTEVIQFLKKFDYTNKNTWDTSSTISSHRIIPKVK